MTIEEPPAEATPDPPTEATPDPPTEATPDPPADTPKIRRLSRVDVGDGTTARLVAAVLHAVDPEDAGRGCEYLARACLVNEWTVYRWLKGTHEPRRRQRAVLEREAEERGIDPADPPKVEVQVKAGAA